MEGSGGQIWSALHAVAGCDLIADSLLTGDELDELDDG